jgi:hypothetical protein
MSLIESPSRVGIALEVDATHRAGRFSRRPLDHVVGQDVGGHYRLAARSGALTAAGIVAGAPLFSLRWTDPLLQFVLLRLEAFFVPTTAFTAAQELGLDAMLVSGFTASDSAGTAIVVGAGGRARRTGMNPSTGIGDMRIATTTLLTAGTRTLDPFPFVGGAGLVNVVNAAAGTQYLNPGGGAVPFGFRYEPTQDEHPVTLRQNEGLLVRNVVIFPAAGVATLHVNLAWAELPAL